MSGWVRIGWMGGSWVDVWQLVGWVSGVCDRWREEKEKGGVLKGFLR